MADIAYFGLIMNIWVALGFILGTTRDSDAWQPTRPPSLIETPFLSVFDISHTDKPELTSLVESCGQPRSSAQLKAELQALPAQETGTFRFYVGEDT